MKKITLKNEFQTLTILTTGATIHEWRCFGDQRNIVISNEDLNVYKMINMGYFNQTIGRATNRIKDGKFSLNGKDYQLAKNFSGGNHGHGGPTGFSIREFEIVNVSETKVQLKYVSAHMEEGYPGELTLYVTYELMADKFKITFDATTSEDTIVNITNHAHFNLSKEDTILNHEVLVTADHTLEYNDYLITTGKYNPVKNTPFDLNTFKKLSDVILKDEVQHMTLGLDHAYLFKNDMRKVHLKYKDKNLVIETSYPGVQIYSMNYPVTQKLLDGRVFEQYTGIAFEPQFEPNGINIPHFNQPILRKGEQYHQEILYHIFEDGK